MAETSSAFTGPVTEDALIAERQRFWSGFMNATFGAVVAIVILLILMAFFLL
jgi:hypothetical protein